MSAAPSGFSAEQRRMLPTLLVPAFMSLLSVSVVNVTLPAIGDSLNAGTSGLQWVISGYALVFGGPVNYLVRRKRLRCECFSSPDTLVQSPDEYVMWCCAPTLVISSEPSPSFM